MTGQLNGTNASFSGGVAAGTSVTGPMLDKGGEVFNVIAYGAAGNGSTDDTMALQATLNAVPTGGGTVVFPANYTFKQTAQLSVKPNTILIIDGKLTESISSQSSANTGLICAGSCTVRGSGTRAYTEDGSGQSAAITVQHGAVNISGVIFTWGGSSRPRYVIFAAVDSAGISKFNIHGITCTVVEYCILRKTSTTTTVSQITVSDNQSYDQTRVPRVEHRAIRWPACRLGQQCSLHSQ